MNRRSRSSALILAGIMLLALNLRPAAASVGPLLPEITRGLHLSTPVAGLLTALPLLAFALFSAAGPAAARIFGIHRATLLSIFAISIGLLARALAESTWAFMILSVVALAGMAMASVLLPLLVRLHFPRLLSSLAAPYSRMLALGFALAAAFTVPISRSGGGWRTGLAVWGVLGLVTAIPWLGLIRPDLLLAPEPRIIRFVEMIRTRTSQVLALFFGLHVMQAYIVMAWFTTLWREHGFSSTQAGLLVALIAIMAIPLTVGASAMATRSLHPVRLVYGIVACYPIAYAGLLLAPHALAIPCALLLGVASVTFPISLALMARHATTSDGFLALSGVSQAVGYLIAAVGPFVVGILHADADSWRWPFVFLLVASLPLLALVRAVIRPSHVEDELPETLKRAVPVTGS